MNKKILLIFLTCILLCSCSAQKTEDVNTAAELKIIKNYFSAIYKISQTSDEEMTVATSADISKSVEEIKNKLKKFDKGSFYLKECLKSMEDMRLLLSEDNIDKELIQGLDITVNKLAHNINEKNNAEIMRTVNDGIYIISAILNYYDKNNNTSELQIEYCLNLLEIESENKEKLNEAVNLTVKVISEIKLDRREQEKIKKSLESINSASELYDGKLIRTKVNIMRDNLGKISFEE